MPLQPTTAPVRATLIPPAPRIPRRIIALRLPWWPTERLVRRRPEARTHPFVTTGENRNRLVIIAANPRAIRAGLTPGMPLADARAIVPDVVVHPADPAADALALERLARWTDRFTPRVMPDGVDTIFLDIAGCARLFGGEEALMASLRVALEEFGLTVRLALADTPGAAWALAHFGADDPAVVLPDAGLSGLMDALAELPVAALRLSPEVADGLVSFGLDTVRTLSVMESAKLIRRFGVEPVRRLQQALGQVDEPIIPLRPLPPREAQRAFAEPISTRVRHPRRGRRPPGRSLPGTEPVRGGGAPTAPRLLPGRRRPAQSHHRHQPAAPPQEAAHGTLRREAGAGRARLRDRRDHVGYRRGGDDRRGAGGVGRQRRGRPQGHAHRGTPRWRQRRS